MTYFESFILGLVQGLGEFLPISSSAHLVVAPWFLEFQDPGLAFDVALHFGTLLAVLSYFWKDWRSLTHGSLQYLKTKDPLIKKSHLFSFQLFLYLVLATIPAVIFALLLGETVEHEFREPLIVAANMILFGVVLWLADNKWATQKKDVSQITLKIALVIGLAQALALLPGVSRSGITITAALFLGFRRTDAARFSFLLATPIIFGACIKNYDYFLTALFDLKALLGIVTATFFGFLSIKYLMKLVENFTYNIFCYYRFLFGAIVIGVYFLR